MENLYLLFAVFLFIRGCNTRVVPLNFKIDESAHTDSSITENELIDESSEKELEILIESLPDIIQGDDLNFFIDGDNDTSTLEILNRNTNGTDSSSEKATHEELKLVYSESTVIYDDIPKLNLTSQVIGKNDSESKEPLEILQVNGTLYDESIGNLNAKSKTLSANNSSASNLEKESDIEFTKNEEKILNDTVNAIFTIFNGTNHTEDFPQVQPISNDTEVEVFLSSAENTTDHLNATSAIFEVLNVTNNSDNSQLLQSMSNDTKVELVPLDPENGTEKLKSKNLITENPDLVNDSADDAGVIMAGFEFLINSEVARNAAKAMEVFNFSDPLTDHIMEENEFHSFLPAFNDEENLHLANQTNLKTEILDTDHSKNSDKNQANSDTILPSGENTFMMVNQSEKLENQDFSMQINISEPIGERNETESFNVTEFKKNVSSEISSLLKNSEKTGPASNVTTSKEDISGSGSNSSSVGVPECPPPGWCVFGFLSQDTCAVNKHCLGNRICCKIGCSKTCIEV